MIKREDGLLVQMKENLNDMKEPTKLGPRKEGGRRDCPEWAEPGVSKGTERSVRLGGGSKEPTGAGGAGRPHSRKGVWI